MDQALPQVRHRYWNTFMDSARWNDFAVRAGDIIVCTPYKAGTTWTQMICALLIFQDPKLPLPLAELSPWFDMRPYPLEELVARYEAQGHRRFIKTHTPLDGLPYFKDATYLYCGRDPRDVFLSMQQHKANQNVGHLLEMMRARGEELSPTPESPADLNEAFQLWMTKGSFEWEQDGYPFWSVFHHLETFWQFRHLPNVHFLHYADLSADLEGQMRSVATILGIHVDEARWPALIKAATFEEMKRNADRTAPDTDLHIWRENSRFFHSGTSGKWRAELSAASLECYNRVSRQREPTVTIEWLQQGGSVVGNPKNL